MGVNVIKVQADKEGRIFITLYGTKYEIVIDKPKREVKGIKEDKV